MFKSFALVSVLALVAGGACKSDQPRDTPATLAKLEDCTAQLGKLADKDKLIASYEQEIARLKLGGADGGSYTFVLEGDLWTRAAKPSGGGGGGGGRLDDKAADTLGKEFIALVEHARGPIQKCYVQALKKNTAPQARTVSLKVSASFGGDGGFRKASFSPPLGDAFETCMRAVAGRWKLTATGGAATFQATVSLSPS